MASGGKSQGSAAIPGNPRDDKLFRVAVESSPSGMIVVDAGGLIVLVNGEIERIFGYSRAELIGQPVQLLVPEDIREAHAEHSASFTSQPSHRELGSGRVLRGRRRDGSEVPVEIGLKSIETDEGLRVLASVVDITNRLRDSAALEESETRYRLLSETSFDGIAISEGGIILEMNSGFARIFGRESSELIGSPIVDLVSEESRDEVRGQLAREGPGRYELVATRGDGGKIRLEATFDTFKAGGRLKRITAVRDVTEKHNLEREFRHAQKMEAVGRLAGGVAHDFNNLLTVISSYTSLLLDEDSLPGPVRDDLTEIGKAAERAATLTRQLLAFSRKQVLETRSLDLNAVVRDAEKMLRRLIGEDVLLQTLLGVDLGCVMADFGQIEQVIMNMAVNARDAMPDGGSLTIETSNIEFDGVFIREGVPLKPGSYVLLAISDTGVGMDDETQAQIFEPFFTTKEVGRGTGLGLAMVYGIVKQSGGCVAVFSELGKGTTFNIYLPRVNSVADPARPARISGSKRGTETVLLVEDVEALRDIERRVLERNGYHVLDAHDAPTALALAASYDGQIQLLLTDVVLPGMGGWELSEQLHRMRPNLKVLFTSGYTDDAVVRRNIVEGGAVFMKKPFTPEMLAVRVREVLD